jgi:hypothetical protein
MTNLREFIRLVIVLFLFFLTYGNIQIAFAQCETVSEIPMSECEALVSLYNSAGGDSWSNNSGWLISNTPCSWYGVLCLNGHVSNLTLPSNQLSGSIPPELGNLANLIQLYLWSNQLSGSIPSQLGNLANLTELALNYNQLSGSIPSELGNLANLTRLYLDNNELWGKIPGELMNLAALTSLNSLDICNNHLYTNDPDLRDFLNGIQIGGDWESCQTPPFFKPMPGIPLLLLDD